MCSDLTEALEELKTCALEVRLKEREATQATEDLKQRLKESSVDDKRRSTTRAMRHDMQQQSVFGLPFQRLCRARHSCSAKQSSTTICMNMFMYVHSFPHYP